MTLAALAAGSSVDYGSHVTAQSTPGDGKEMP